MGTWETRRDGAVGPYDDMVVARAAVPVGKRHAAIIVPGTMPGIDVSNYWRSPSGEGYRRTN